MKVIFNNNKTVDFLLRLLLTVVIISPVIYYSWDGIIGTTASDYIESVIFILFIGFIWMMSSMLFLLFQGQVKK
ncbi:conjugal transfer protein TrbE [uncultured Cedecea sp.]|uniref:conjugal transfer protein TrbE n=1 Tax=uncultured Cedecea sp. TaxID=988762 RepID=UPI0026176110|nr:conjugal transfer protein TrbE [uncultured Cedecea sp.]